MPTQSGAPTIAAEDARRLLLHRQGLLDDPSRHVTPAVLRRTIERMGFVQLDSINVVARAHHMILASRFDGYRPEHLRVLLEKRRHLFEHWTHDASAIPTAFFVSWRHRCRQMAGSTWATRWLKRRLGSRWTRTLRDVRARIVEQGPLMSKDFDHPRRRGESSAWWGWKPSKAALEYLWWRGDLTVAARVNFHKVYDLTERCFPDLCHLEPPDLDEFLAWACRESLDRLGTATPREVAGFFGGVPLAFARAWCQKETKAGRVVPVHLANGERTLPAVAVPDWRRRLAQARRGLAAEQTRDRFRLLSPFDPVIRDRARLERLFGFDYRFEAFVPAAKRTYGYYVLPVLHGEALVGRCDAKLHRDRSVLEIKGLWWEPGRGKTKKDRDRFARAARRLADFVDAESMELP